MRLAGSRHVVKRREVRTFGHDRHTPARNSACAGGENARKDTFVRLGSVSYYHYTTHTHVRRSTVFTANNFLLSRLLHLSGCPSHCLCVCVCAMISTTTVA